MIVKLLLGGQDGNLGGLSLKTLLYFYMCSQSAQMHHNHESHKKKNHNYIMNHALHQHHLDQHFIFILQHKYKL